MHRRLGVGVPSPPSQGLVRTLAVKRGDYKPRPCCEHGTWTFAGADRKRSATTWRCSTGECKPASVWVKADKAASADPTRDRAALSSPRVCKARLWPTEAQRGTRASASAPLGAYAAARRPHDLLAVDGNAGSLARTGSRVDLICFWHSLAKFRSEPKELQDVHLEACQPS